MKKTKLLCMLPAILYGFIGNAQTDSVGLKQIDPRFAVSAERELTDTTEVYHFYLQNLTSDEYAVVANFKLDSTCHTPRNFNLHANGKRTLKPNGLFTLTSEIKIAKGKGGKKNCVETAQEVQGYLSGIRYVFVNIRKISEATIATEEEGTAPKENEKTTGHENPGHQQDQNQNPQNSGSGKDTLQVGQPNANVPMDKGNTAGPGTGSETKTEPGQGSLAGDTNSQASTSGNQVSEEAKKKAEIEAAEEKARQESEAARVHAEEQAKQKAEAEANAAVARAKAKQEAEDARKLAERKEAERVAAQAAAEEKARQESEAARVHAEEQAKQKAEAEANAAAARAKAKQEAEDARKLAKRKEAERVAAQAAAEAARDKAQKEAEQARKRAEEEAEKRMEAEAAREKAQREAEEARERADWEAKERAAAREAAESARERAQHEAEEARERAAEAEEARERAEREAEERAAAKEAAEAARERAQKEAAQARERAAEEAEKRAEAEAARIHAEREAEEARERAEREAEERVAAREAAEAARERARKDAEEARERAAEEAERRSEAEAAREKAESEAQEAGESTERTPGQSEKENAVSSAAPTPGSATEPISKPGPSGELNFYTDFGAGLSSFGMPVIYIKDQGSTADPSLPEVLEPGELNTFNLDLRLNMGFSHRNIEFEVYAAPTAGTNFKSGSIISLLNYGANGAIGFSWLKAYGGIHMGTRDVSYEFDEPKGSGESKHDFTRISYGLKFTFNPNGSGARKHLLIGVLSEKLTVQDDYAYLDEASSDLIFNETTNNVEGFFMEYKKDHSFSIYLKAYSNFPFTGKVSGSYLLGAGFEEEPSESFIEVGFIKSFSLID